MRKTQGLNQDIIEFSTLETKCVYQENKKMKMEYKYIKDSPLNLNTNLVQRGWRRFGKTYLRPNCLNCKECKSVKIDVENFIYSKSKRKTIKRNSNTKTLIASPTISKQKIYLYNKFHAFKNRQLNWKDKTIKLESYFSSFIQGCSDYGKEILYYIDGNLVAVDYVDFIDDGISSIYFFYDPDYLDYELGKYSLYLQINLAKEMSLKWIYLGYYVEDCRSLNYKYNFKPRKTLLGNPSDYQKDIWI